MEKQNISYSEFIANSFLTLIFVSLPFEIIQQLMYKAIANIDDKTIYGVLGVLLSFAENILVLLALGYGLKRIQKPRCLFSDHILKYSKDLIIEILRGIGKIAVGLLLIIPGCRRMVYFYFIPYVVQFDENYEKGQVDVLVECEKLLKGKLWSFSGLLILTQIVTFGIELLSVKYNFFTNPLTWAMLFVLGLLVESYIFLLFYKYYLNRKNTVRALSA